MIREMIEKLAMKYYQCKYAYFYKGLRGLSLELFDLSNLSGCQSDEPVKKESLIKEFLRKGKALKNKIKEKYPLWGKALRKD